MEENKSCKKMPYIIVGVSIVLIVLGIVLLLPNKTEKKNSGSYKPDDPKPQNNVVLDSFTYSFLKLETNKNNLVYSPLSIKYALSMLSEGAVGTTKEEIDNVIKDLGLTKYDNIENVLSLANSIFVRESFKESVKNDYINNLKNKYNAEVIYDKFDDAKNVNEWIENKTFGLIKNMLKDEQVQDTDVEMLLINALAIDMAWKYEFTREDTTSRPFTKADGEKIDVAMMHLSTTANGVKYYQDDDYTEVALPFREYGDTNLEFVAIMPNEEKLHTVLTSDDLENTINSLLDKLKSPENEELSISLPRFDFEYKASVKSDLQSIGIKAAFDPNIVDLSLISDKPLKVDDVLHKAMIRCSEKGVKAAAVTVIIVKDNAMVLDPDQKVIKYLNFNKPFMFIIRDRDTNEIWFVGTIYEPTLWKDAKKDYDYN